MSKRSPSVIEPLDDMWWCNKKQKFNNELDVYSMYVIIPFFLHKMLASHRQPTFRDRRWTKYSNPGQLYPPRPPNFKVVFFFQGVETGGQNKSNPTAWHKAHTFFNFDIWGRGCRPILSSRFEYFVHLRSRNVGCLWDASILCRKNGMITYIEYTSNSLLNFCFLLHHHMSSKGSMTLGDLFDMDMDLGSHKASQQWTSCRQCCVFSSAFLPGLWHGCVFTWILAAYAIPRVFTVPFRLSCE